MVLDLYVAPPAFGLPSYDPECVAAVAYLSRCMKEEEEQEWRLRAWLGAGKELPALHDGDTIINGYGDIVQYLSNREIGKHYDEILAPIQKADALAFTSHIHMTLSPLLLLYLYLTPKNWHSGTRTALSTPLPFPIRYIIPPQLRTLARSRTTHLGFSSLDLTAAAEEDERKAEKEAGLPEGNNVSSSLRNALKNRRTPASAVRRDTALQIKVHALIDTALESLTDLLSRNDNKSSFFLDAEEEITSFDCLALGYLSLALIPQMESDWLQKGMLTKYPTLCTFINQGVKRCFGGVSTSSPTPTGSESPLPWSTPTTPSLLQTTFILLRNTLSDEPLLSQLSQRLSPSPQILASKTTPARSIPSTSLIPIIFRSTAFIGLSWIGGSILWPEWFKMNLRGMIFELAGEELRIEGGSRREKEREGEGGLGEAENLLGSLWREN